MPLTVEQLRASVTAVGDFVAVAYARFDPPFDTETLGVRLVGLAGVWPAVADRFAAAYQTITDGFGDGGKTAVLITCRIVESATASGATLPRGVPEAIATAAGRVAEAVEDRAVVLRSPEEVERVAVTAAGGNIAIGGAILEAIWHGGKDGVINVVPGEADQPPGVTVTDGEVISEYGIPQTVSVRGETAAETTALYLRAWSSLHSAMGSIISGVVPGGGAGFAVAATALTGEASAGARAVAAGLEAPLRVRAIAAGLDPDGLLDALRDNPRVAFDQTIPGLVSSAERGPLDAVRIVQAVIREAGNAAADLLRLV